jgi:hypothetical protein
LPIGSPGRGTPQLALEREAAVRSLSPRGRALYVHEDLEPVPLAVGSRERSQRRDDLTTPANGASDVRQRRPDPERDRRAAAGEDLDAQGARVVDEGLEDLLQPDAERETS